MKTEDIDKLIKLREQQLKELRWMFAYVQKLNADVGLSEDVMKELQAKISSRIAFCERSIIDHKETQHQ